MAHKRAVVFSGGGAKGGYQVGAWKALRELGYEPEIVTGTSVGALNGALMALGKYDEAVDIWENMSMNSVFAKYVESIGGDDAEKKNYLALFAREILKGGADYTPLQELVKGLMDEEGLRDSDIRFGLVTTRFPSVRPVQLFIDDIPKGEAADYVIASAAAFPFLKSYKIGESKFVDGAYSENMPIKMALSAGADEIVAINIASMNVGRIDTTDALIHYVCPTKELMEKKIGNFLVFDNELSRKSIRQGYLDTLKCFSLYDGRVYTFEKDEKYRFGRFEAVCGDLYNKVFHNVPNVSRTEARARRDILELLSRRGKHPFEFNSNVLYCAELAAEFFDVDVLNIYTVESLTDIILSQARELLGETNASERSEKLDKALDKGISRELLRSVSDIFDKRVIMAYIIEMLRKKNLEPAEKRRLWLAASMNTGLFCAALYVVAAMILNS